MAEYLWGHWFDEKESLRTFVSGKIDNTNTFWDLKRKIKGKKLRKIFVKENTQETGSGKVSRNLDQEF